MKVQLKVFIGYDPKENPNYEVALYSILKNTSIKTQVVPLQLDVLRKKGLYTREVDTKASNEFSISRFLTPYLAGFKGLALFMDCDMLLTADLGQLLDFHKPEYAIHCVKHDYIPKESTKFLGQKQETYPRKNWSSFVLYNCEHKLVKQLTPDLVNKATPQFLHRFEHFPNETIGALPIVWNWLVDEYELKTDTQVLDIKNFHFTLGSPQFEGYESCGFSGLWKYYYDESKNGYKNKTVELRRLKDVIREAQEYHKIKNGGCGC